MKILQLIQKAQFRGAEIFSCQLGNQLNEFGNEVYLVSLFSGKSSLPFLGNQICLDRIANKRVIDWTGWKLLDNLIRKNDIAIIQANAGDTLKYAVLSKIFFRWKAPIVFRNASTISSYVKSPIIKWWNALLFRFVAQVISVSEASRQDFVKLFPFMKNRIAVIGIGIDFKSLQEKEHKGRPYLLHVGGFTFEKNHHRLLHIFKAILDRQPQLELLLIGDGLLRSKIEELAIQLKISDHVRFLGFQSDVYPYLQSAKALLLPSVIEGLPGVILEAMYCKTPVVAYDVGGISEVVKDQETGRLINAGDEEKFIDAIIHILNGSYDTVIDNAHKMVVQKFDNREIAKRFLNVYERVIRN